MVRMILPIDDKNKKKICLYFVWQLPLLRLLYKTYFEKNPLPEEQGIKTFTFDFGGPLYYIRVPSSRDRGGCSIRKLLRACCRRELQ